MTNYEKVREWKLKNKDKVREQWKRYYQKHKEQEKERRRKNYQKYKLGGVKEC